MAILQALLTTLIRSIGKLANTILGWATLLLFGKVPARRQHYLSIIALMSLIWLITLLGLIFPKFAVFLLTFITLPAWLETWTRMIMLIAVLFIPAMIGTASLFAIEKKSRPSSCVNTLKMVGKGYPYTLGFALTIVVMCLWAPIIKMRNLIKHWESAHIPFITKPEDYDEILSSIQEILLKNNIPSSVERAHWMLRLPARILAFFSRSSIGSLVAKDLKMIQAQKAEILFHPSDLVISGRKAMVAHTRALLCEHLSLGKGYLTWSKESQEMEDSLRKMKELASSPKERDAILQDLSEISTRLHTLDLDYEEWETLFREKLQLEVYLCRK